MPSSVCNAYSVGTVSGLPRLFNSFGVASAKPSVGTRFLPLLSTAVSSTAVRNERSDN